MKKTYFCGINWQRWIATVYASIWRKVRTRDEYHTLCDTDFNGVEMSVTYTTKIDGADYVLMRTTKEWGGVWLLGNVSFDIQYVDTFVEHMEGRNEILNDYNNSHLRGNPRK